MFLLLRIWALGTVTLQCIENPINVFPEMKLRGLVPNPYIHVSINRSQIHECGNWETEHYNSVLEIRGCVVSFLGIHQSKPDIYFGFSPAQLLQCTLL
jgi:hypothetical protein